MPGPKVAILKRACIALFLVVLVCVAPRFRRLTLPTYPADFNVYFCAASLVRQHHAADLYQGADTGTDPQKALAPANSPIFQAAAERGLSFVGLYVYPPILADMLVPYTFLNLPAATHLWLLTNGLFLLLTALIVVQLLELPLLSWQAGLVTLALACFTPSLQCLVDGQITILLLLLWSAATLLYKQRHEGAAGALFALAAAIKLTPAIVLLPLLLWKRWRALALFTATALLLVAVSASVNSPRALHTFAARVLPAMSGAIPSYSNYSLPCSIQRFLALVHDGTVAAAPASMPTSSVLAGRITSALVTLLLAGLLARTARGIGQHNQVFVLALFSLVAPIVSPVSWFHAYTTAFLAFAVLWRDFLRQQTTLLELGTLTVVSLLLGSAVSENLIPQLLFSGHPALSSLLHLGQLVAALALVAHRLWLLPGGRSPAAESPALPLAPASATV